MLKIYFYHDTRRKNDGDVYPVRLIIADKESRTMMPTEVKLSKTDFKAVTTGRVKTHELQRIKNKLDRMRVDAEDMAAALATMGADATPAAVKDAILDKQNPGRKEKREMRQRAERQLRTWFQRRLEFKTGKTADSIRQTLVKIDEFAPGITLAELSPSWLMRFDAHMAKTAPSPNSRAVHMRNLRAVVNFAIDEGATTNYPFRRYRIKTIETAKRSLSVEDLRRFFNAPVDETEQKYLDFFKLSFFLIGINSVDLLHLRHDNMYDGRITFNRSKTKRLYSLKVEPEALELLEKYKGKNWLICPCDKVGNWEHYRRRVNKALAKIGETTVGNHGKKTHTPMFPNISTYWARHSWATIAASLDVPKDTIAAALGHGGNTVTDIYIDFDRQKIDEANRRVLDWVLYGKSDKKEPPHVGGGGFDYAVAGWGCGW